MLRLLSSVGNAEISMSAAIQRLLRSKGLDDLVVR